MGISVMVRTFTGEIEARCTHPAIGALCQRASHLKMPMIGLVDPYDDTVFNRSQMRVVVPELQRLADQSPDEDAQAAQEIIALTHTVERKPHRYLIFNGD